MKTFAERYEHFIQEQRRYCLTQMRDEPWHRRSFYATVCFIAVVYDEIISNRLFVRSSSTAYTTMLALIPFLIVGGSFILMFNKEASMESIIDAINSYLIPSAGDTVVGYLTDSLERTLAVGLGPVGVIGLFVTSVMLFIHIEDCINDLWYIRRSRTFHLRILLIYAVVTLGPVLISFSIYQGAHFFSGLDAGLGLGKYLGTHLLTVLIYFALYKYVPNTRVEMANAFFPAVLVALCFEISKYGFAYYMKVAFQSSYSVLYGAIGLVPLLIVWIYLIWILTYIGVELCYCSQNFRNLLLRRLYENRNSDHERWIFLGPYAPIEILAALVRNLALGKTPSSSDELAMTCRYPAVAVDAVLARLSALGVIGSVEGEFQKAYFLQRPLDVIKLRDVIQAFDETSPRVLDYPRLQALIAELREAQAQIWGEQDANSLREANAETALTPMLPELNDELEQLQEES